jgi:hypothetical protein
MKIDNNTPVVPSYPQNVSTEPAPPRAEQQTVKAQPAVAQAAALQDRAEVSPAALSALETSEALRANVVSRVKAQISAGTYLTPDKISGAVDRLAEQLSE